MSLQAIVAAIETKAPTTSAKLLMLILANYADADGRCYPGQKTLCDDTGLSERAVRDNLKALEADGLIRRQERRRQDGSKTSDLFFLLFTHPAKSAGSTPPAETDTAHRQMPPSSPAPVAGHEPKEERSEEPSSLRSDSRELILVGEILPPEKKQALAVVETQIKGITAHGTRLPPDWRPSEVDMVYALQHGFTARPALAIAEDFRDYWIAQAGAKGRKADWPATWRTWIRRQEERGGRNGSGNRPHRQEQNAQDAYAASQELFGRDPGDDDYGRQ